MGSKSIKILMIVMLFPIIGMAQGIAFRKADTALVTSDAGALRVFKSQPYYSSLLALKVKYTDTLTKIATKTYTNTKLSLTGGTLTGSLNGTQATFVASGSAIRARSTGGIGNVAVEFQSNTSTRLGYVGFGSASNNNMNLSCDLGSISYTGTSHIFNSGITGTTGNFTGLVKGITPTVAADFTIKSYVDAADALKLNISSILTATATLDFPSVSASQNSTLTITVTGATIGDVVSIGIPNSLLTGLTWNASFIAWVSATNTVSVRFQNNDPASAHDLASTSFTVKVLK